MERRRARPPPRGSRSTRGVPGGPLILWTASGSSSEGYVAAFNTGEDELAVSLDSQNVGLPAALGSEVRELWSGDVVPARSVRVQSDEARRVAPGSTS